MFKLSEAAELLKIDKIKIIEQIMISNELLKNNIQTKNHLIHINKEGMMLLVEIFETTLHIEEEIEEEKIDEKKPDKDEELKILEEEVERVKGNLKELTNKILEKEKLIDRYLHALNNDNEKDKKLFEYLDVK